MIFHSHQKGIIQGFGSVHAFNIVPADNLASRAERAPGDFDIPWLGSPVTSLVWCMTGRLVDTRNHCMTIQKLTLGPRRRVFCKGDGEPS